MEETVQFGQSGQGGIHCLSIIGHIEGHMNLPEDMKTTKYEHMLPLIAALEETAEVRAVLILINTVGGDVEAGLAIAELMAGMSKPTASLVLGGGHSIGVPLAVAADRSFIAPSASMTIHPVRFNGPVIGAPQTFDYLKRIQQSVDGFILSHSHISPGRLHELLHETAQLANDVGSVLTGREAVQAGLMDRVGTLNDALNYLRDRAAGKNT